MPAGRAGHVAKPNATIRDYVRAMTEACPPETWRQIVEQAVQHAGQGDRYAREWLSAYLMGRPDGVATTLHTLAVEEIAGTDHVARDADLERLLGV